MEVACIYTFSQVCSSTLTTKADTAHMRQTHVQESNVPPSAQYEQDMICCTVRPALQRYLGWLAFSVMLQCAGGGSVKHYYAIASNV